MKPTPNPTLFASKGEFPKQPSKPKISSDCELRPGLIAWFGHNPSLGLKLKTLAITC